MHMVQCFYHKASPITFYNHSDKDYVMLNSKLSLNSVLCFIIDFVSCTHLVFIYLFIYFISIDHYT
jgi:hypothetical protein